MISPLNGITLLVAEDERPVRMLLRIVLEAAGARVLTAEDGTSATRLLALHPEIDLLCTDLNMPRMDGEALTHAARGRRSDLPIVVCSATDLATAAPSLTSIVEGVVRKPFVPSDLVQVIRTAVDMSCERTALDTAV